MKKKEELEYEYDKLQKKLSKKIPTEIQIIEVCKYMGWSYKEVMETPMDIIQAIYAKMSLDK